MDAKKFTIKELERFSGIKAHTLRAWERRYALFKPDRTSNNFRLYNLDELKKLLNIALLKRNGYAVSRLVNMISIEDKIKLLSNDESKWQKAINDLTVTMYEDNESFESVLEKFLLTWPIKILVEMVLFPFLKITNLLWIGHKLSEEHIVVTSIRKKLILAIESVKTNSKTDKRTVLLFLPDTKQLDLGLLYAYYFLKGRGVHILYLGNDVTVQNLKNILAMHPTTYLFTYLPPNDHFSLEQLLGCMDINACYAKLIIADYLIENAVPVFSDRLIKMSYADSLEFLFQSCQ